MSTEKYKDLVNMVLASSGIFGLLYVALRSPEIACERVARRVVKMLKLDQDLKVRDEWIDATGGKG